jgi:hypothetical protein
MIVHADIEQFTGFPHGIERDAGGDDGQHRKAGNQANAR